MWNRHRILEYMFSGADSFNKPLNDWNVSNDVTSMAVRRNESRVIELPDDDVEFDSDFGWRKNQRPPRGS